MGAIYAALRLITKPLDRMTDVMIRLADGEADVEVPATERRDEIGAMARAVEVFRKNAAELRRLSVEQERLQAEAKEQVLRRRFAQAMDSAAQAIVLYDADNRVVACNTAFLDLHKNEAGARPEMAAVVGVTFRDMLALHFRSTLGDIADNDLERLIAAQDAKHRIDQHERTFQFAKHRWMHLINRMAPDGGVITVLTDITALKTAEAQRRELEAQLHHSQRLEALGTMAGGIAHDLNNTLVPILGLVDLTAETLPPGSRERASLEIVGDAARRAKALVSQILAFSRKEKGQLRVFDFAHLVRKAVTLLRSAVPATIAIEQAIDDTPPVEGDDGQLHQVVVNLITNASQAIGDGPGVITVSLQSLPHRDEAPWIRLTVRDTGCGMDETTRVRIFEPFFTTKGVNEGTGLGLSVVHGIVTAHGGTITVASEPGTGSTFVVDLPIARRDPATDVAPLAA